MKRSLALVAAFGLALALSGAKASAAGIVSDEAVIGATAMLVAHAKCSSLTEAGMIRVIDISKLATEAQINRASTFVAKQFNTVGKDVFCAMARGAVNPGTFK